LVERCRPGPQDLTSRDRPPRSLRHGTQRCAGMAQDFYEATPGGVAASPEENMHMPNPMTVLGVFGRLGLKLAAALSTVALLSAAAPAQELPQQLTIVVPYAAGGPGDIAARLIFDKVQAQS